MYVFFLGVVPFISLVLFFVYYLRQNRPLFLRKAPNVYVPKSRVKPQHSSTSMHDPTLKKKLLITDTKLISTTNPHVLSKSRELVFV